MELSEFLPPDPQSEVADAWGRVREWEWAVSFWVLFQLKTTTKPNGRGGFPASTISCREPPMALGV